MKRSFYGNFDQKVSDSNVSATLSKYSTIQNWIAFSQKKNPTTVCLILKYNAEVCLETLLLFDLALMMIII